jgi:hypothetical protein
MATEILRRARKRDEAIEQDSEAGSVWPLLKAADPAEACKAALDDGRAYLGALLAQPTGCVRDDLMAQLRSWEGESPEMVPEPLKRYFGLLAGTVSSWNEGPGKVSSWMHSYTLELLEEQRPPGWPHSYAPAPPAPPADANGAPPTEMGAAWHLLRLKAAGGAHADQPLGPLPMGPPTDPPTRGARKNAGGTGAQTALRLGDFSFAWHLERVVADERRDERREGWVVERRKGGGPRRRELLLLDHPSREPHVAHGLVHAELCAREHLNRGAVLALDLALDPRGEEVAVAAPGGAARGAQVLRYRFDRLYSNVEQGCVRDTATSVAMAQVPGRAVAVAYDPEGRLVVQTHGPLALHVFDTGYDGAREGGLLRSFTLDGGYTLDAAQSLFHSDTGARVTCASCHPEGEDDGRVWNLEGVGARRTPTLRGGLLATAPFNWEGDAADLHVATQRTYAAQALGGSLAPAQLDAAVRWLDGLPAIRRAPQGDAARVAAGRAVFEDPTVGCAGCHAGPRLTNNENHDVGTGGAYQVPSLVDVAARGPWMHDGRAHTLRQAVLLGEGHGLLRGQAQELAGGAVWAPPGGIPHPHPLAQAVR